MDMLKEALTNAPALATIDYAENAGEIILAVDASSEDWGTILQQVDNGKKDGTNSTDSGKNKGKRHSIRYESGLWTGDEKKYDAGKWECRALLWALKKLQIWLYGMHFVIEIDAKTLLHQLNLPIVDLPGTIVTRWIICIKLFDFDVCHVAG